ncbi:DUF2975 domain-containing protein [Streptomyces lichenis]|uniref:DUF2975 domain-containing protein n=1 Tax=Streptomyces lichenis TaxID=2306967 RepID=A0ABT0II59_9ACTN|nr:DUF2975 domain-containing protein [Streptomyces lichenis]MCK8681011.1 DUF2975 domain-containing protein [Streptomyces lichenis]
MHRLFIAALRAGICVALSAGLFGQLVVLPATAADEVDRFPPYAPLAVPYTAVAILGVLCVQVALVATWALLTMVERDAIFTSRAFRWVDVIIGSALVATVLAAGAAAHLAVAEIPSPGDGMDVLGALFAATGCAGVGAAFTMLVVVMKGLLRKATELRTEMAGVV